MKKFFLSVFACILACSFASGQSSTGINIDEYHIGEGLWFTSKDNRNQLNLHAYVQTLFQTNTTEKLKQYDSRFQVRRARLSLDGVVKKYHLIYRVRFDMSGLVDSSANGSENEAWIGWMPGKRHRIIFGQRQTLSDNFERSMASEALAFPERSAVTSAFASIRDFGLYYDVRFRLWKDAEIRPAISILTGDGVNALGRNYGGYKYEARVDFLPFGRFGNGGMYKGYDNMREYKPKVLLSAYYSYNNGQSSREGSKGGDILYLDANQHVLLPDYTKYGADLMVKYRGFSFLAEYSGARSSVPSDIFYRVRNDGSLSTSFLIANTTVNDKTSYVNSRMILGSGYNLQLSYLTRKRYSIGIRYTSLSPDSYSFLTNNTYWNRNEYMELGVGKFFTRNDAYKVQASVSYNKVGANATRADGFPVNGTRELIGRLLFQFSF